MKVNNNFKVLEEYSTPVLELIGAAIDVALCTSTNEPFEENEDWGNIGNWE